WGVKEQMGGAESPGAWGGGERVCRGVVIVAVPGFARQAACRRPTWAGGLAKVAKVAKVAGSFGQVDLGVPGGRWPPYCGRSTSRWPTGHRGGVEPARRSRPAAEVDTGRGRSYHGGEVGTSSSIG